MNFEVELANALRAQSPSLYLRSFIQELLDKGESKENLLKSLSVFRQKLSSPNQEKEDDLILDMMDYITGWCSPHMRLGE